MIVYSMLRSFFLIFLLTVNLSLSFAQSNFELMVLGISQDGGYPQAGCQKVCCQIYEKIKTDKHYITSLALIDKNTNSVWLIDCTPDFKEQWTMVDLYLNGNAKLKGIILTHAHIGHYLGLAQLGREVMGADAVPVYVMPRMKSFLESNGPWDQLVKLENIKLREIQNESVVKLTEELELKPVLVPHRDEYSEVVGFIIYGPHKTISFIPDIDKWENWDKDIGEVIESSDISFIDATFYDENELPDRDMSEIPHPFVVESMDLLKNLTHKNKSKVHFIHLNHTNPLHYDSELLKSLREKGFNVAEQGQVVEF